jgi:putative nucleotidyltransferase with HDIG domain
MTSNQAMGRDADIRPPPQLMGQLCSILADPAHDARLVGRAVAMDPSLSAAILRIVNSAFSGTRTEIESVQRAVVSLGEQELVRMVMTRIGTWLQGGALSGYGLEPNGLWERSLRTAIAAEATAKRIGYPQPAVAYTAGLLVDVGKIALSQRLEQWLVDVIEALSAETGEQFDSIERRMSGTDHAEIGAQLAIGWRLPPVLVDTIRWHHHPAHATVDKRLTYIVHMADTIAALTGGVSALDTFRYPTAEDCLTYVPLTEADTQSLMLQVIEGVEQARRWLAS